MSQRYSRLYSLPENQYYAGSPVIVLAGALLKDNVTGQVLAQLKFKSISLKQIKAIKVVLFPLDAAGRPLDGQIEHQYLDLCFGRNAEFGQKQAIPMPNLSTRAYSVTVSEVVFSDNSVYIGSGEVFSPRPKPQLLSNHLGSTELLKQYRIACGDSSEYVPTRTEDLWYCTCGHINHIEEFACKSCSQSFVTLTAALDKATLTTAAEQRLAREAEQAERQRQQQQAEAERKKKKKRLLVRTLIIIALIGVLAVMGFKFWLQPTLQYNDAVTMLESAQYDSARKQLTALNGFGKSEQTLDVLDALIQLEDADSMTQLEDGIRTVLASGTPVTVQFETKGGTLEQNPVAYLTEDDFSSLPEAEQEGLRFVEWEFQSLSYQKKQPLSVTVKAEWSDEFLIAYELNGGYAQNPSQYRNDGKTISLNEPTYTGYTFVGWTGSNLTEPTMNVVIPAGTHGNLTYTANWKADTYTITLDSSGGAGVPAKIDAVYGSSVTLPSPSKVGYTFVGWFAAEKEYTSGTWTVPGNKTLIAKWNPINYKITYNLNDGKNSSENPASYTVESGTITIQPPSKAGYKFLGWYSDAVFQNKVTQLSSSAMKEVTLYAKWEIATYTLTYNLNGGTLTGSATKTFTFNDLPISLPSATKTGCTFLGWYDGSTKCTNWNDPTDVTLTAKWDPIKYKITYNLNGGTNSSKNPSSYHVESGIITLQDPTRNGYKFLGWYGDSGYTTKVTTLSGSSMKDVSLYAKWEIITYTITYNLNGGSLSGTAKKSFTVNDLPITLPGASKSSLTFTGWNYGSASGKTVDKLTDCGNAVLYACFIDSGLQFSLSRDGKYYSVSYTGSASHVDVPAYYKNLPVTVIGYRAFGGAFANSTLKSVSLPNTITDIATESFYCCDGLKSIVIPNSVTSIGDEAFWSCDSLKEVTLSNALESIGEGAFSYCSALTSILIPDSVTTLGSQAFSGCGALQTVVLSKNLKTIEAFTFSRCRSLTSIVLHEGLKEIGLDAFQNCSSLKKIIIPASVTEIYCYSEGPFVGCNSLTIYCRASVMPDTWRGGWNDNRPVVWGYTGN